MNKNPLLRLAVATFALGLMPLSFMELATANDSTAPRNTTPTISVQDPIRTVSEASVLSWKLNFPESVTLGEHMTSINAWEVKADGAPIGLIVGPTVVDSNGKTPTTTGSISGDSISVSLNSEIAFPATVGVQFQAYDSGDASNSDRVSPQGKPVVGVPNGYIYDPHRKWPSLEIQWQHDYCSWSPDALGNADFRGPCAKHDMCYERYNSKPKNQKKDLRARNCQEPFRNELRTNCEFYLQGFLATPARAACLASKEVYYEAVVNQNRFS